MSNIAWWLGCLGLLFFKTGSSCKISRKNSKKTFSSFFLPHFFRLLRLSFSSPFKSFPLFLSFLHAVSAMNENPSRVGSSSGLRGSFFWRLDTKVEETLFKRERKEERERKRERERVGGTPLHSMKVYKNPRNCHIFSFGNRVKRAKMAIGESPPHSPIPS